MEYTLAPNPPANLTVTDGGSVTSVAYTVINNTVGVNDGYVVKYFQWNGTGFIEVGEDNNTGASYSETGSFSGLTKGDLYKLKAYADGECSEYELSTEDVIAYYQAGTPRLSLLIIQTRIKYDVIQIIPVLYDPVMISRRPLVISYDYRTGTIYIKWFLYCNLTQSFYVSILSMKIKTAVQRKQKIL